VSQSPLLQIRKVSKYFDDCLAVDNVDLDILPGEFFCLLGGSGSGKTTLLRMLAGFETPSSGQILLEGRDITRMPPYTRPINMMFQSYALFPHMSVTKNIAFGLKQEGMSSKEMDQRVDQALAMVEMRHLAKRKPHQLSGGQKQRVALARCLAKRPKLILLDEPLSALDKKLREQMQFELVDIQEELNMTFVMVTHDQSEAMTMSSRLAVMHEGFVEQIGTPTQVYEFPTSRYTAEFIGYTNIFECRVTRNTHRQAIFTSDELQCQFYIDHGIEASEQQTLWLGVRPEKVFIDKRKPEGYDNKKPVNAIYGVVEDIAYLGGLSTYHVRLPSGKLVRATDFNVERKTDHPTWNDSVYLWWEPANVMVLKS
jgi:putrescine transport system ATP-binding protein